MNINTSPNINYLWSQLIIEELYRNGVEHICVAPGSRSSALAIAAGANVHIKTHVHFDERGLGFYALGIASATRKPVGIITTSGTAVANLLPAVIEASKKKLPLIILTADRPPELRNTGANQTIQQVNIFGEYARWFVDLPTPTLEIPCAFVLTTVDQAIKRSKGELPGPVHLNCMFREPLAPTQTTTDFSPVLNVLADWLGGATPFTAYAPVDLSVSETEAKKIADELCAVSSGLIVVGKLSSAAEQQAVLALSEQLGWPIWADITSGLRLGQTHNHVLQYFDHFFHCTKFSKQFNIDGILHVGGRLTSKRYYQFIEHQRPKTYIMVLNHPLRNDPTYQVTKRVHCSVERFCEKIVPHLRAPHSYKAMDTLQEANKAVDHLLNNFLIKEEHLNEVNAVRIISEEINHHGLFLSNSLPIREMDMYAGIREKHIPISANRGASGIDGILASATGFAQGLESGVTLVIGDLALLHDLNSLALVKQSSFPITIVVLNNQGGGVFSFLPIAEEQKYFEKFFGTPHEYAFEQAANMFGLNYEHPKTTKDFRYGYQEALRNRTSAIIEVKSDRNANFKIQKDLHKQTAIELNTIFQEEHKHASSNKKK